MANRNIVEDYYNDISCLTDLLSRLVNSYRLLIGGAGEYNQIALATKRDVKRAIKRANKLGELIDALMDEMDVLNEEYTEYCKLKRSMLQKSINSKFIENEFEQELKK